MAPHHTGLAQPRELPIDGIPTRASLITKRHRGSLGGERLDQLGVHQRITHRNRNRLLMCIQPNKLGKLVYDLSSFMVALRGGECSP